MAFPSLSGGTHLDFCSLPNFYFSKQLEHNFQGVLKFPPLPNALKWLTTRSGIFGWGEDRVLKEYGQAVIAQASFPYDTKVEG